MNTLAQKTRTGAAILLGFGLVLGTISAQAANPSTATDSQSNPQRTTQQKAGTFEIKNAFAFQQPAGIGALSDNFSDTPDNNGASEHTIQRFKRERSNSPAVLKYQSPYMSAPY
ncbi:hypothetical protein [Salinisphaera sp. LB1]|uniref:hypothetical protein n=1 Tax=Salinisphaera sp. LB1 TaxID=2183911 RepID=UPI000D70878B|nr:hypothetical protein [Salinisphaera sp. LB1]AWN16896.1 hypothetical protein SALB1_2700 [Salinisphaera sp. LB1]